MTAAVALGVGLAATACGDGDPSEPEVLLDLPNAGSGQTVGLAAVEPPDGIRTIEWVDRLDGTVQRLDIDASDPSADTVHTLDVGTDGEQRGLLGQVVFDGRRFVSWTRPDSFELVVGEILPDGDQRIVWSAGEAGGGAIGGVLDEREGQIVLGLGRNTEWDRDSAVGGAILLIDPSGSPDQQPEELSIGYTNPWAFTATADGSVWVADNAAGPDPDDETRDDVERIGRADVEDDRNDMAEIAGRGRAPAAMVELADGRIGICGFLDNELRAYDVVDTELGPATGLEPAETVMPCNTGAAVFDDGTIVTVAQTDDGESLVVLRP